MFFDKAHSLSYFYAPNESVYQIHAKKHIVVKRIHILKLIKYFSNNSFTIKFIFIKIKANINLTMVLVFIF